MDGMLYHQAGTQEAIVKASQSGELVLKDFFQAWPIPVPVMAERLRRAGYHLTSYDLHTMVASDRESERHLGDYVLKVILLELRNDIDKVINLPG